MFKARYLLSLALAPAVLLFFYIRKKDKIEQEPMRLLLLLVGLGTVSTIPACIYENIFMAPFDSIFKGTEWTYNFATCFFIVGVAEEGYKLLILWAVTWRSKEFNYTFDAVVYAVSVSLGFAALENILYVFMSDNGWTTGILRALTSVPGHTIFAVHMGYYYGAAKKFSVMKKRGLTFICLVLAFVVPVIIHGFYDFCLGTEPVSIFLTVFFAFDIAITITAFFKVNRLSNYDTPLSPDIQPGTRQPVQYTINR